MAVMPVIRAFETALNQGLLLESERHRHYFAFDTTELLKGDILKRYQAYQIGLANNFLQADEVRYKEDLKPLGFNFIRLGLQDVLLDPKTNTIYTPNTNQTTMFGQSIQQSEKPFNEKTEERWEGQRRESNGQFGKGKNPRSAHKSEKQKNKQSKNNQEKSIDKSSKNGIIEHKGSTKSRKGKGTVKLSKKEYRKVVSEINTVYHSRYEGKRVCYHPTLWRDKYYTYRFKNHGFDDYEFEERKKN